MSDDPTPSSPTPESRPGRVGPDAGPGGDSGADPSLAGLDRLLPEVDEDAAAAVFARSRSRRHRQRRTVQLVGAAATVLVVGLLAVSLTGGDSEPEDLVTAGPDDPSEEPNIEGGVDGPVVYAGRATAEGSDGALVSGMLRRDGDCLYLVSGDPDQPDLYPVMWPHGTTWQEDPEAVISSDGSAIPIGTFFSAGGGFHALGAGPRLDLPDEAMDRLERCAMGEHREVAVVQGPVQWWWEEPYEGELSEITVVDHGVEMTLSAAPVARVGDHLDVTVTIANVSEESIVLGSGSACDPGASVGLRPEGSDVPAGTEHHGTQGTLHEGWDGNLAVLADWLGAQAGPRNLAGRAPDDLWVRVPGCRGMLVPPQELGPGESVVIGLVIQLRWGLDGVPEQAEVVATSSNLGRAGEASSGELTEGPQLTAVLPIGLIDDPTRAGSVDEVLGPDGVVAAPGLADWIELSTPGDSWNMAPGTTFEQTWQTDLYWWDGLWVLWIDPDWLDGNITGPLRIQYDPERGEVVDVRTVAAGNGASADDPGAPDGYPPDTIIHQAD